MEQTLINNIDKWTDELKFILDKKEIEKLSFPTEWAFYYIMERYYVNLKTIYDLIPKLHKDTLIEIPMGLIMRASLLDSLMALDFFCLSLDADDMEAKIQVYLVDHVINTHKYFEDLKKYGEIDDKDFYLSRINMEKETKFLLDKMGIENMDDLISNKENYKCPSPKIIFNRLVSSKYKAFAKCFDHYNYYSKYEHFGLLYPLFSRLDYKEKLKILESSLNYIFLIINILVDNEKKYEANY